jgi:large subunit ribosomal protein L7/L12
MSMIKKTLAAVAITAALFSSSVMANAAGDAKVRAAGEETVAKVQEALALTQKGADKAEVLKVLGDARQAQKEFRYEQTERLRQKAGDRLKAAREEVDTGNSNAAATLQATLDMYKEMMKVYSAAH